MECSATPRPNKLPKKNLFSPRYIIDWGERLNPNREIEACGSHGPHPNTKFELYAKFQAMTRHRP